MNSNRRIIVVLLIVVLLGVGATTTLYLASRGGSPAGRPLPSGCARPAGGFLVIASDTGYNDSMAHGVPQKSWPTITVREGQNVTIVVCNTDAQAHGFQIAHYYDSTNGHSEVTLIPGQVIKVNFIANQAGSFAIVCEIFCTIHWAMQSGLLNVTAS